MIIMIRRTILLISVFFIFSSFAGTVWGSTSNNVTIEVNSRLKQHSPQFKTNVRISFSNIKLYNDRVLLSYHVYDSRDAKILWEGARVPFTIDNSGKGSLTVDINLNSLLPADKLKYAKLKFDFVDENNAYWFSRNNDILLKSDTIILDQSLSSKFIGTLTGVLEDSPISFSINVIIFLLAIYSLVRLRKSGIL
ncbi:hypothetical protein [Paenibacillus sp. NPDC058177]|uniref:hypothetical protein n=1 Tax=Paenibacillus sp. NPDC058177 TaxID=3346369 RepID=UPI0036DA0C5D